MSRCPDTSSVPDAWEHLLHGQERDLDELVASRLDRGLRCKRVGSEDVSGVSAAPYPRRQQAYRLKRAAVAAAGAVAITAAGLTAALAGLTALAVVLLLTAGAVGLYARHWARLAGRSRVGARSEDEVRRALGTLDREGWRLRHSIAWQRGGDIDHVAIAPTGIAFAIETKTRTYEPRHLAKINEQAAWLHRHRRRWCPHGAFPVLCVTRGRTEQIQHDVLVVSVNRLIGALRTAAGTRTQPKFLIASRAAGRGSSRVTASPRYQDCTGRPLTGVVRVGKGPWHGAVRRLEVGHEDDAAGTRRAHRGRNGAQFGERGDVLELPYAGRGAARRGHP
jgi:hypothetical protein